MQVTTHYRVISVLKGQFFSGSNDSKDGHLEKLQDEIDRAKKDMQQVAMDDETNFVRKAELRQDLQKRLHILQRQAQTRQIELQNIHSLEETDSKAVTNAKEWSYDQKMKEYITAGEVVPMNLNQVYLDLLA